VTALLFIALVFAPYGAAAFITDVAVFIARRRRDYYRRRLEALERVGQLPAHLDKSALHHPRCALRLGAPGCDCQLHPLRGALDALEEGCFCDENPCCLCCKAREDLIVAFDPNACPGCISEGLAHFCGYES
jgi:hypothetical protein